MFCDSEAEQQRDFKMAASSYLKISVCLIIIFIYLPASAPLGCSMACAGLRSQAALIKCFDDCAKNAERRPNYFRRGGYKRRIARGKAPAENEDGYGDLTDGLRSKRNVH